MRDRNILFPEESLDDMLRPKVRQAESIVNGIPNEQFRISSDDEIIDHSVAQLTVMPIQLHKDATTMDQTETQVDISGDPNRYFTDEDRGPIYIPGTRVIVEVPFTGDQWVFKYRTNPFSPALPRPRWST